ncbi:MAG TPA: hypothetical protein VFC50_00715 [Candidatus Dormibacteraeota bacterium]|nr:hypothetical protein [Candidatus Dormibacteraeota bacterium]
MPTIGSRRTYGNPVSVQALLEFIAPTPAQLAASTKFNISNICVGPDGNFYASVENDTTSNRPKIVQCTPSGVITQLPLTGGSPAPGVADNFGGICTGPDGNIWLCDSSNANIYKVSTAGTIINNYAPGAGTNGLAGIVTGSNGNMWFADNVSSQLGTMTTSGGSISWFPTGGGCHGLSVGPDGNLWYTRQAANIVGRCTTAGSITNVAVGPATGPFFTNAGPDGHVWFTGRSNGTIGRITLPGLGVSVWTMPAGSGSGTGGCGAGPTAAGTMWFTEETSNKVASLPVTGTSTPGGLLQQANNTAVTSTVTVTLGAAATAGNLLVCFVQARTGTTAITGPSGFTQLGSQVNGTSCSIAAFYKTAVGGETSFAPSNTGTVISAEVFEVFGQTASPINTTSGVGYNTSTVTATSITTGAVTPATSSSLILTAIVINGSNATFSNSWTNGWRSLGISSDLHEEWASLQTTSTSSLSTNEGFSAVSKNAASFTVVVNTTAPSITETTIPTTSSVPDKIILGNDGNMWCTEHDAGTFLNVRLT